jgi:two-component system sensor histidine kinase DctS
MPANPATSAPAQQPAPADWHLRVPYLTMPLLLVLIALLVWLTRDYDQEEQQTNLISDVLWMEQNLHFQLERNEGHLADLAPTLLAEAQRTVRTEARLRQLLGPDSGLVRIAWLDATGKRLGSQPPESPGNGGSTEREATLRIAEGLGRAVYGTAYPVPGDNAHFEVHLPYFNETGFRGVVVGIYSLRDLISREVPWWFSERYRVSAVNSDGVELAAKSKVAPLSAQLEYLIPFDPPGHGLSLKITAYKGETRWIPILLVASMILLGGVLVWSLVQQRRHTARRRAAERARAEAMAFRKAMEDSLLTGLRARDLEGRITYVNPAFCRMTGYEPEELIGQAPPMPYWDPADPQNMAERQAQILTGSAPATGVERSLIRKNGERFDALVFDAPLIDAEGRHTGWMGSVLEITEQKRMREMARQQEDRLQATSRLVTMGEMASTLAHELNQPLAAISSYSSGCLNRIEAGNASMDELREIIAKLGKQAQRAGQIIRRVHDFVRRAEPKREMLDVNGLMLEAIALVEPDSRKRRIRIESDLAPHLPQVPADRVMIEQVVINLIRNGMDAMRDTSGARVLRVATLAQEDHVVIRVADTGGGIPPELARLLFEPFFTTKSEGMGMGLNICRSIAELHRGKLGFEPNPEGGTIFTFSLPVAPL